MRKLFLLLFLAALSLSLSPAQEEPIPPKRSRMVKVGLFGAFTPGLIFPNFKPINDFIVAGKGTAFDEKGMYMAGGAGAAYIMLIPNFRVGGLGMGGSQKTTSLDVATGIRRDSEFHIGYGGVTLEYVFPIWERFDIACGIMLGGGSVDITVSQYNGGPNTWKSEQDLFGSNLGAPGNNLTRRISGGFYMYIPSVYFEYTILNWMAVRLGGSYVGMASPTWTVDSNYDLLNVPGDVSGKGFMINMGLMVGTF